MRLRNLGSIRRRVLVGGGAVLAVLLVGAGLLGSAFAQGTSTNGAATPGTTSGAATPQAGAQGAYQDFVNKLAKNLGISDPATVNTAIRTTLKQMVDEQLAAGHISADEATRLKQQIDAGKVPLAPWIGLGREGRFRGRGGFSGPRGPRHGQFPGGKASKPNQQVPAMATPSV